MKSITGSNKDEIDLYDVTSLIWRRKYFIFGFTFIVCVVSAIILLRMDNIYQSQAILKPSINAGGSNGITSNMSSLASLAGINLNNASDVTPYNAMNAIVSDPMFMPYFIQKNHFEKSIFGSDSNILKDKKYKDNKNFFINKQIGKDFKFVFDEKTGLMTMSMQNRDTRFPERFIVKILPEISLRYRKLELNSLQQQIDNYKQEISITSDITLKNKLSDVVASLIQKKIVTQAQKYYGFEVISYPSVSDHLDKVGPRRAIILIIIFLSAVILSSSFFIIFDFNREKEN